MHILKRAIPVAGIAVLLCSSTNAAKADDRWLFVPAFDSLKDSGVSAAELTAPWEHELPNSLRNADAAVEFERGASEPVELDDKVVNRLIAGLAQLEVGGRKQGGRALQALQKMSATERDSWQRAPERAQKQFDACVLFSYLLQRDNKHADATRQMLECVRRFPGFAPTLPGPPQEQQLLAQAEDQLSREPHGGLTVTSSQNNCVVRLDGLQIGVTPLSIASIPLGPEGEQVVSVQAECEHGVPGRRHTLVVRSGTNTVNIDPQFDAAVHTQAGLELRYSSDAARSQLLAAHEKALVNALDVPHIVVLVVDRNPASGVISVTPHSVSPSTQFPTISFATGAYDPVMFKHVVDDLRQSTRSVTGATAATASGQLLVPAQLETGPDPDDTPVTSQLEPRDADSGLRLGVALTMSTLGLGAIVTSWAIYAGRQSLRMQPRALVPFSVADSFASRGAWSLVTGGLGAGFLMGAQFVWLPQTDTAVPTWAWLIGGAGLVGEAVGLGFAVGGTHCAPLATLPGVELDRTCQRVTSDVTFGWNIALDALPMLSLPLSFAVRSWLGSDVQLGLTGPGFSLRGRF